MPGDAPGEIRISLPNVQALLDRDTPPEFPFTGPLVREGVAKFVSNEARERRNPSAYQLEISLQQPPLSEAEQGEVRAAVQGYFAARADEVDRDFRVNRVEGWASARYAIPITLITLAFAGVFYAFVAVQEKSLALDFLSTFVYLVFISVVWVMLWDPIEKLLFVGFGIRAERDALQKLSRANIRLSFSSTGATPGSTPGPRGSSG